MYPGQQDPQKPIHWLLIEYAIAVNFFYHASKLAAVDIFSEDPTANGLFPSTTSSHTIDMPEVDIENFEGGKEAQADVDLLLQNDEDGRFREILAQTEQDED